MKRKRIKFENLRGTLLALLGGAASYLAIAYLPRLGVDPLLAATGTALLAGAGTLFTDGLVQAALAGAAAGAGANLVQLWLDRRAAQNAAAVSASPGAATPVAAPRRQAAESLLDRAFERALRNRRRQAAADAQDQPRVEARPDPATQPAAGSGDPELPTVGTQAVEGTAAGAPNVAAQVETVLAQFTDEDQANTKRVKVDTHRNTLAVAKNFGKWCVARGLISSNPFDRVEPVGRRKRGKEQLRVDEARKFLAVCHRLAEQGDEGAIAAMAALLLGLRASEIVERVARDLDDGGRLLWIPAAKTDAGRRTLEVPEQLQPYLRKLADGKRAADRLFPGRDRYWVLYQVRRICALAKVPVVSAHSLRGLHATLATEWGSTGRIVAAALGHTSFDNTTRRHYLAPGTLERVAARRLVEVIDRPSEATTSEATSANENEIDDEAA